MNKRQQAAFGKRYSAILEKLTKDRDELRNFIADIEAVDESCERALDVLEEAADCISEYL